MRTPVLILILALLVATGGIALAAIPAADGTITACVHKRSGAVRVIDTAKRKRCRSSERRLAWSQRGPAGRSGAAGANGTPGAPGAQGSAGAAGAGGGTSDVYTKTEADARFLGKTETAQNALRLGGALDSAYVRTSASFADLVDVAGGGGLSGFTVADAAGTVGQIEMSCADPATQATTRFRVAAGRSANVMTDDGGATPVFDAVPAGAVSTSAVSTGPDHIVIQLHTADAVAVVDLWVRLAPGGANACRVAGRVDVRPS